MAGIQTKFHTSGGAKMTFLKTRVKMNGSTDLNEAHTTCDFHSQNTTEFVYKKIYSVRLIRCTEKYFHFEFTK
jgi:hypothetical protein